MRKAQLLLAAIICRLPAQIGRKRILSAEHLAASAQTRSVKAKMQPCMCKQWDRRKSLDDQTAVRKALLWLELQRAHRNEIKASYSSASRSLAMTVKSSRVVVSPLTVPPAAICLSRRRMIFPQRVLGSASAKRMSSGLATAPISFATCWRSSVSELLARVKPSLQRHERDHALAFQFVGTADDRGLGDCFVWLTSALSTSAVPMRWPATLSTSSIRPTIQKYPSLSRRAPSPVK